MSRKGETPKSKSELKEDKDADPALFARNRLKGALLQELGAHQDLIPSEHSTDSDEFKSKPKRSDKEKYFSVKKKKQRISPMKTPSFQNPFVMKLFDRSVDLAQFEEITPLYPICRAWMANKPRGLLNNQKDKESLKKLKNEKRDKEKLKKDQDASSKDVYYLPPPLPATEEHSRIPKPIVREKEDLQLDEDKPQQNKEILLASHLAHWQNVRRAFREASMKNEERYEASDIILRRIYNSAAIR